MVPLPEGIHPIACKWVFTIKHHPGDSIERYKVQLVAKEYTQTLGIDFFETFSLVAQLSFIRVLVSVAINKDWLMHQFDVKNAFHCGDLTKKVCMEQPPTFVTQGETYLLCKLKKVINGLK